MEAMAISKELRASIESNQARLKNAIRNHQVIFGKLRENPDNVELREQIKAAQENIVVIGCEQKSIIDRLRKEYKTYQKTIKSTTTKNCVEEKRANLTNALNRARKQNIVNRVNSGTSASPSDESECSLGPPTPEPAHNPTGPHEVTQGEFLAHFGLGTHDAYRLMQNKRVERKRRSTANPQFLYHRGWDFSTKRSKRTYASNASPPHTRQAAVRNKQHRCEQRGSPPKKCPPSPLPPPPPPPPLPPPSSGAAAPEDGAAVAAAAFPTIPNLPSGLTIERVNPAGRTVGERACVECKTAGNLLFCDLCTGGFHLSCHNRPLSQTPRQCPKCITGKETRTVGSLNVPSGMSVSYISQSDVTAKLRERDDLLEKKRDLTSELTRLQDKHSQLTISLKTQQIEREELLGTQQSTEDKIQKILKFISSVKCEVSGSELKTSA